ncbi:olfactory receptor 11L1-like [Bufo bufo]|uniref:olfactory receptor 11L1-like n=1 Tax=Bufo bufo TaxID=8384 RepID=UPI001ABDE4DB|nr:olfactory receptor 11L1-like [Bufo bufo]
MPVRNLTLITEIRLLGFQSFHQLNGLLFILFFLIYYVTMSGNMIIILLVTRSRRLQSPMYFFLTQLSLSDSLMATSITPNTLYVVMNHDATITFTGCLAQFYFFSASLALESLLLTGMSYDRYLAICNPLRYTSIMDYLFCIKFIACSWILSFSVILNHVLAICSLEFCGPNVIDHYFCDLSPLLELSCSDTFIVQVEVTLLVIPMALCQFLLVIVSYSYIIFTILRIPSVTGRQKAFSTCSSHLTIVSMYYGTLLCTYLVPTRGPSLTASKALSLLYTMVIPCMNPIIYSLRNKDIKEAFYKLNLLMR